LKIVIFFGVFGRAHKEQMFTKMRQPFEMFLIELSIQREIINHIAL
jgi:hypothetical protein